jgi:hypothetical protein
VSTPRETHVFKPESNSISHIDAAMVAGVATNVSTIAMSNIARRVPRIANKSTSTYTDSSFAVQVTMNEVLLIDVDQALGVPVLVGEPWNPRNVEAWQEKQIVAADINASQITLALTGGILVLLNLDANDRFHLVAYVVYNFITIDFTLVLTATKTLAVIYLLSLVCRRILQAFIPPFLSSVFGSQIPCTYYHSVTLAVHSNSSARVHPSLLCPILFCFTTLDQAMMLITPIIGHIF